MSLGSILTMSWPWMGHFVCWFLFPLCVRGDSIMVLIWNSRVMRLVTEGALEGHSQTAAGIWILWGPCEDADFGSGRHFLQALSSVKFSSVAQSCLTLCNSMDYSLPDFSVHETSQARILEWVAISFSRRSSWPRDQTSISCIDRQVLYHWPTWEALLWFC